MEDGLCNQALVTLRRRVLYWANRKGFLNDADDIAQEVLLKYLTSSHTKQSARQRAIDAIRSMYGDSRHKNPNRLNRYVLPQHQVSLDYIEEDCSPEEKERYYMGQKMQTKGVLPLEYSEAIAKMTASKKLKKSERACFLLSRVYGLSLAEIGHLYGLGESRMSQILTDLTDTIEAEIVGYSLPREKENDRPGRCKPRIPKPTCKWCRSNVPQGVAFCSGPCRNKAIEADSGDLTHF